MCTKRYTEDRRSNSRFRCHNATSCISTRGGNFSSNVFVWFGTGTNTTFYNINDIALGLEETCKALTFFHAFTGCDTVSSFFNHGKCKFWDRWQEFDDKDDLTRLFSELSQKPSAITDVQISILEKNLLSVYYANMTGPCDINYQRMHDFEHSVHSNLRLLPPSKICLIEHAKRAAYEAGWAWYQCKENVELPNPEMLEKNNVWAIRTKMAGHPGSNRCRNCYADMWLSESKMHK